MRRGAFATAAQQDHIVGDHFGGPHLFAFFVVVAARLDAAFDVHLLAFGEIGRDVLSAPQDHVGPVGFFLPLARLLIFPAAVRGHRKLGDRRLRGGVRGFGVAAEMSDQNHFIYATTCHDSAL